MRTFRETSFVLKLFVTLSIFSLLVSLSYAPAFAVSDKARSASLCEKYGDCQGFGKYPYNFRSIDNKLFAGGNLFGPAVSKNSPAKVFQYLKLLKSFGVKSVILLNVPAGYSAEGRTIEKYCGELGLEFYPCRMNAETVPDAAQTEKLMRLIDAGAYVHCNWGCDRTGSVIAKYLVEKKGYRGSDAFRAVIGGGSHSGNLGGLKQTPSYKKLLLYFWPGVASEDPKIASKYGIKSK